MTDDAEDRLKALHEKIHRKNTHEDTHDIKASPLERSIISNLKLLKALIRGEKVRLNEFASSELVTKEQQSSSISALQKKIVDEFLRFELHELAAIDIPNKLHEECFELLIQAWRKKIHDTYSQTLSFSNLKFSKKSFRAFVIALTLTVTLKAVRLEKCHIGPNEAKLLAIFVKVHPLLTVFHIDDNPITDEGFDFFVPSIEENKNIIDLNFAKTHIRDKSVSKLVKLLKVCPLKTLNLDGNSFSDENRSLLEKVALEEDCHLSLD